MRKINKKVLVIATSINTKGGITSVIKAYKQTKLWSDWNCFWLSTHIDSNKFIKIYTFLFAVIRFLFLVPFYSIIHIHFSEPASASRKRIFIFFALFFKKKIITHFHSYSIETTINGKYQKLYKNIFFASDRIIVLSEQWKIWLTNKWPALEEKIAVIYNPCPIVQNNKNTNSKSKTIVYAGILNSRKGYSDLIDAFALVAKHNSDWNLIFAGNGEIEKAKKQVNKHQIHKQVTFKGWVKGEQKDELYRSASIFCLPSYAEGFPMAVLDAFAYGLPVVTTPVGGLPDVLIHKSNAMVFQPGDITDLANNIQELISNVDIRKKLSEASFLLSQETFNIERISRQINGLYENLSELNN
jgi:glycosyltransferase involved in cell wall biosynthesis